MFLNLEQRGKLWSLDHPTRRLLFPCIVKKHYRQSR